MILETFALDKIQETGLENVFTGKPMVLRQFKH